jgi:hypothetical protein
VNKIQTLNNIAPVGLDKLPRECYEVSSEMADPDAILVRSAKMHILEIILRLASNIDEITNSLTALAFAPGALNTTTPFAFILSSGF